MMTNADFLSAVRQSFAEFVYSGTSRSTKKLVPLHGSIARDIHERLGNGYGILSQGFESGREGSIPGRYMDKKVDITISHAGQPVGGIAVKFVMQNYSQNANNYFENMLGETANIRSARCPYFQVFIIPDRLPYYTSGGVFKHWETFTEGNIHKYAVLDGDDPSVRYHTPDKMLIYVIHLPDIGEVRDKADYLLKNRAWLDRTEPGTASFKTVPVAQFSNSVILNDYERFAEKVYHTILAR